MEKFIKSLWDKYKKIPLAVKATVAFFICSILQKAISFITIPIFTRLLTTEQYGQYTLYISWLQIFTIITTLRLNFGVFNKGMTKYRDDKDAYTSTMQGITTILTTVFLIVYIVFRKYINNITELSTFITLAMFLELYLEPAISFWTIRQRYDFKYKSVVLVTLLISIGNAIIGLVAVLISENRGIARILSCIIVQVCIGFVIYVYNLKKGKKFIVWEYAKFAIIFNIPLIPHYFSTYILEQFDRIMIQKISGISAAGIYGVAYSAGNVIKIVTNSINNALIPWQYRKLENEKYDDIGKKLMPIIYIVAATLLIFSAFAPEIVKVLSTEEYYEAVNVISPVSISTFFVFLFGLFGNVEFFYDSNKFTMYLSLAGAALNVGLNLIFIPIYGFVAAAYTTLACYIVFTLLHYIYMNYITNKKIGTVLFDTRQILTVSVGLVVVSIIFSTLYNYTFIRYALILFIFIVIFYKRNFIIDAIKNIKS